jgi:hypothetical protein
MRGISRGNIRPWDGSLISIRVELSQVSRTGSASVMCKRSRGLAIPAPGRGEILTVVQNEHTAS